MASAAATQRCLDLLPHARAAASTRTARTPATTARTGPGRLATDSPPGPGGAPRRPGPAPGTGVAGHGGAGGRQQRLQQSPLGVGQVMTVTAADMVDTRPPRGAVCVDTICATPEASPHARRHAQTTPVTFVTGPRGGGGSRRGDHVSGRLVAQDVHCRHQDKLSNDKSRAGRTLATPAHQVSRWSEHSESGILWKLEDVPDESSSSSRL